MNINRSISRPFLLIRSKRSLRLYMVLLLAGLSLAVSSCTTGITTTGPYSGSSGTSSAATTAATAGPTSQATETSTAASGTVTTTIPDTQDTDGPAVVKLIEADEALQILKDIPDAVLLDVRTEQEFVGGHIAGATLIPVDEISARIAELPDDFATPIIVYCRSGNRSATAAWLLIEAGYRAVYDLGGINSWPYEIVR
ncbi:MAG: rhodanese-like domain-containing protein [Bacillota bacterium]|nr:rhodanese-like domain-containing protein [Bacillota bacterium]